MAHVVLDVLALQLKLMNVCAVDLKLVVWKLGAFNLI